MSDNDIQRRLFAIFEDFFDIEESAFGPDLTADQVDDWDSLNHIRLMVEVQKVFGVKFSAGEIGTLSNVGDLIALIQTKQG